VEAQGGKIKVKTASSCNKVRKWAEKLGGELGATEITLPVNENPVYQAANRENNICPPCPIPSALLLAVWVEAGYALRKTPQITFKSE
jgi:hypothetical protein